MPIPCSKRSYYGYRPYILDGLVFCPVPFSHFMGHRTREGTQATWGLLSRATCDFFRLSQKHELGQAGSLSSGDFETRNMDGIYQLKLGTIAESSWGGISNGKPCWCRLKYRRAANIRCWWHGKQQPSRGSWVTLIVECGGKDPVTTGP